MLQSANTIRGFELHATDGTLGRVNDILFDDARWNVRYLVADTRKWLPGRRVLLSPVVLGNVDREQHGVPVSLTKDEIKSSPPIEEHQPVSRQLESSLVHYWGWPLYWGPGIALGPVSGGDAIGNSRAVEEPVPTENRTGDPSLRSDREVEGYNVAALDGEIGHIDDLIIDDESWAVRYLIVYTKNFLPGRKVLVAPAWCSGFDWAGKKVDVQLRREVIKNSPEFDADKMPDRKAETQLYQHYGMTPYWADAAATPNER